ncbi:MAG: hypothetical protein IT250_12760 [Chitinophagaceae bacterium]|nr:hypothetical protein [Chitinophagaceae bacterium]
MKKIVDSATFFLLAIFAIGIISSFIMMNKSRNSAEENISQLRDSIGRVYAENHYMGQLLSLNYSERNRKNEFETIDAFRIEDGKKAPYKKLVSLFKDSQKLLVIRYTEIGCNACTDITIKSIRENKELTKTLNILILVDFTNNDAYLKWKKISEIDYPVLWVKKGDLPFEIEKQSSSYLFTIDSSLVATHFFIPNSMFPVYIRQYLQSIESKL